MTQRSAEELLDDITAATSGEPFHPMMIRSIVEAASEAGALRALAGLGLGDERARRDMDELRELLVAWRDVKRSAWRTTTGWICRVVLAGVMVGTAYHLDLLRLIRP